LHVESFLKDASFARTKNYSRERFFIKISWEEYPNELNNLKQHTIMPTYRHRWTQFLLQISKFETIFLLFSFRCSFLFLKQHSLHFSAPLLLVDSKQQKNNTQKQKGISFCHFCTFICSAHNAWLSCEPNCVGFITP
jgi:hypothetical protein